MDVTQQSKKLPVLRIFKDAVIKPSKAWKRMSIALSFTGLSMIFLQVTASAGILSKGILVNLLYMAIYAALFILFAITTHRSILLGINKTPKFGVIEWKWREWRYVGWALVAYFYLYALMALTGMVVRVIFPIFPSIDGISFYGVLFVISFLPGMYVFARLSLVFPAAALDQAVSLDWVWEITEGNGWRLVLIIGLFPVLLSIVPALLAGVHFLLDAVLIVLGIVLLAMEITALSLSFKYLSENTKLSEGLNG
ncbi:MAG: hypothetical protein ABW096_00605 [Candidatus Thiodiazotropha sp.]